MNKRTLATSLLALAAAGGLLLAGCSSDDGASEDLRGEVVQTYADGVHASYLASLTSAQAMDQAIDAFLAAPSEETLAAAKQAWLAARDDYSPTEAFRFYGGPIDDDDGPEGLINAWPLDEAYIDYVEGNPDAGIINMPDTYPDITADLLVSLNEDGGEVNISTGWHAIEFLLWGQDLNDDGPGDRPVSDYVDAPNAERRATYLATASDLLLVHLQQMVDEWAPDTEGNYRASFLALDVDAALTNILTGVGELSAGELAGERMTVAYEARSQEDEHSCFSDNTTNDIIGNAVGIQRVLEGDYPEVDGTSVDGPGILALVEDSDEKLAASVREAVELSVADARAIPAPFDQHLREDLPDDDPGRASILATIEALESQRDLIVEAADALGLSISVS